MSGMWLILSGLFTLFAHAICRLQPYYLHFPPPIIPVLNNIDSDYRNPAWSQLPVPLRNSTVARNGNNFPSGPIPLVVHTWVNPDSSEGTRLQNGTLIYYVGGPWGGIRAKTPMSSEAPPKVPVSNSIESSTVSSERDYPVPEREALLQRLPPQDPNSFGWTNIDITTISPSRQQEGPWGHGHLGFGWPTSTQLYDKIPDITTIQTPTRSQSLNATTIATTSTEASPVTSSTPGGAVSTSTVATTEDPVAASTNARFPVSDSVRKFRRIVAQIRAITKKELAARAAKKSK